MLSKMMRRARIVATLVLLAGCQSTLDRTLDRTVSARAERREINVAFTIENNLLRLRDVSLGARGGRYVLGSAHPRTVIQPGFVSGEPRRMALALNERESVPVEPIYMPLGAVGDAIIGFDAWAPQAITIDYAKGLITYQTDGIHTDGMTLYRFEDEPAISLMVNGRRVPAAVDTASPETLVLPRGTAAAGRTTVDVEIAGVMFENVDVLLADVSRARIGNRLLSKFLVSIHYGQRQVGLWRDPRVR